MKPVSVGFCTYNRLELTKKMFESFSKNTNTPYNLTIVDNGSTDSTVEWLKNIQTSDECKSLHIIYNDNNKGIAYARNQCLKSGMKNNPDYFCTLDNDVLFPENWLKDIIKVMNSNNDYCIGLNYEGVNYPLVKLNGYEFECKDHGNLGTATAVFPKALVDKIGGMKEYALYGEEDSNFFFRARCVGYKMGYLKKSIHLGEGENDIGEYREWKTTCHKANYNEFVKDCHDYIQKKQDLYIPYEHVDI